MQQSSAVYNVTESPFHETATASLRQTSISPLVCYTVFNNRFTALTRLQFAPQIRPMPDGNSLGAVLVKKNSYFETNTHKNFPTMFCTG